MEERLDDVEFLARSAHRVAVLEAVDETPRSRQALQSTTGASRVTIGRIVTDLEQRGWIRQSDDRYHPTPVGRAIAEAFDALRGTLEAAAVLEPLTPSLPDDFLTVDINHFSDAEVSVPTPQDPLAAARAAARLMAEANHVLMLAHAVTSETVDSQIRAIEQRGQSSAVVLSAATHEAMQADPTLLDQLHRLQSHEEVRVFRYEGRLPVSMGVYDKAIVGIGTVDDAGFPNAFLVSTDDEVLTWAQQTFSTIRDQSEALPKREFPDGSENG